MANPHCLYKNIYHSIQSNCWPFLIIFDDEIHNQQSPLHLLYSDPNWATKSNPYPISLYYE